MNKYSFVLYTLLANRKIMEVKKVYDCQIMPKNIRRLFLEVTGAKGGNDIYIGWNVKAKTKYELDKHRVINQIYKDEEEYIEGYFGEETNGDYIKEVDEWLLKNAAEGGEHVIIKRWW